MKRLTYPAALTAALAVMLLVVLGVVIGCSRAIEPEPSRPTSETTPSGEATSSAEPVALDELEIALEPVADGFSDPLYVTHAGDGSGRVFVVEQTGRIRVVRDGRVSEGAFLDMSDRITTGGERGLLGLAFAEDYEMSGRFYINYTDSQGDTIVARYTAADPESDAPRIRGSRTLLKVAQPYANHNGGCLQFAPDGTLWVGMGDGGSGGDPEGRAQNPKELLGKMISLDVSDEARTQPRIVARGLRNPWRYSFDRATETVWIGDVGQDSLEEIDRVAWDRMQGANFGWDLYEGSRPFQPQGRGRKGLIFPVIEYGRDIGQSVTGGYVYRGSRYPALVGTYFYGDFGSGLIAAAQVGDSGKVSNRFLLPDSGVRPASFGVDEQNELYVVDYAGGLYRVTSP